MLRVRRRLEGRYLYTNQLPIYVSRTEEGFYLEQHSHDFVEIIYVEEGAGFHYIEDEIVRVRKGDIFYLPLGTSHVFRPSGQLPSPQLIVYNCVVDASFLKRLLDLHELKLPFDPLYITTDNQGYPWLSFEDKGEEIGSIFRSMFSEYSMQGTGRKPALSAWLLLLHVKLFHPFGQKIEKPRASDVQILTAVKWLDRNCCGTVTLDQTAAEAGISPRHFHRLFKARTGQTFHTYVQNKRINHSCKMLETTALSVMEISYAVGYKDLKSFYRVFKKIVGSTPSAYRRSRTNY